MLAIISLEFEIFYCLWILLWYMCCRQTIDLYGSVQSPSLTFLGGPSMSQLGSSFMSSSLIRRYTPDRLPSFSKPLIPAIDAHKEGRSTYLPSPALSRRASLRKSVLEKKASIAHEAPVSYQSTYGQAVINGMLSLSNHKLTRPRNIAC